MVIRPGEDDDDDDDDDDDVLMSLLEPPHVASIKKPFVCLKAKATLDPTQVQ